MGLFHGHAPFVWGSSGRKAVETAFALEVIAEMAMKTLALNPEAAPLSPAQQALFEEARLQCLLRTG